MSVHNYNSIYYILYRMQSQLYNTAIYNYYKTRIARTGVNTALLGLLATIN